MQFVFPASLAVAASGMTSYTKVAQSDLYYGGIGPVQGFTFPQMGGHNGDQVELAAYTTDSYFLGVFDPSGSGLISGVNASTSTRVGKLEAFGDFAVSKGNPEAPGKPVTAFVSSTSAYDGIFVQLPDGTIAVVASTQTLFEPAGGVLFNFLASPSVELSEDLSTIYVAFAARAGSYASGWRGIVRGSVPINGGNVTLEKIVDNTENIPGTSDLFKCVSSPKVTSKGHVIFFGSHCGSNGASEMVLNQFNNDVMYKGEPVLKHALTRARQVGASNLRAGIWRATDGGITCVVCENTIIPDGTDGERFVAFSDAGLGLDGTVAFVALGSNGSYGIYKDTGASHLTVVVNNKASVPGHSDCNFANFPHVPSVDANGRAVFFGQCTESVGGVYSESARGYGTYGTLIDYDDKVDGSNTIYIGYGANAVSGTTAALYIVLDDSDTTNGVWAFQVPSTDLAIA